MLSYAENRHGVRGSALYAIPKATYGNLPAQMRLLSPLPAGIKYAGSVCHKIKYPAANGSGIFP